jgi:hypothetical protein
LNKKKKWERVLLGFASLVMLCNFFTNDWEGETRRPFTTGIMNFVDNKTKL